MINEFLFIFHTIIIASFALGSLTLGASALIAFTCTCCILANLFVTKQIILFGFTATCTDAFTVGATLGLNLLQEFYGKKATKKAIWTNFFLLIFYTIVSQLHLLYMPHPADRMQQYFEPLLQFMPRIAIASLIVFLIAQMADFYFYGLIKKIFHNKYLVIRNYISIALCQLLDTILFSFFGLYGIIDDIWHVIVISYLIKLLSIFLATPFIGLSKKLYRATKHST